MLQLLQAKSIFGGFYHENPHEHIRNFVKTYSLFSLKDISQESIRLRTEYDNDLVVVTRCAKIVVGNAKVNDGVKAHEEEKDIDEEEKPIQALASFMLKEKDENHKQSPVEELQKVEALLAIPGYTKFMKELVTKSRTMDFETIEVSHNCSANMTREMIKKKEDLGAFTIPCTIGMLQFAKALCDLGATINLVTYAIYKQLGLGEPKSTTIQLFMVDQSIKNPIGILYDILVKVDRFILPADFVILDCEIDAEFSIILGRPFLATGRAL
ncbi:uncharacterized protein LOC125833036 [Solanum verrucosum]|uniref:uncharacterized protein LOC125833036 n=1 Tax=Solanum verrucosum TaxID=315347 RepID=UPI0020D1441E|nr:uncharacterized protein LOC125833036 [Solanum verrucosum]